MEIKIKPFYTWATEHFVLYMNGNEAGSFHTYEEAEAYGERLVEQWLKDFSDALKLFDEEE